MERHPEDRVIPEECRRARLWRNRRLCSLSVFDSRTGHSWASGMSRYMAGTNQASSINVGQAWQSGAGRPRTDNPPEVSGINRLPIMPMLLWLGHDPDCILRNYVSTRRAE